jgi:hypothetical protein
LGAYQGLSSIPGEWIQKLELREAIVQIADELLSYYQRAGKW